MMNLCFEILINIIKQLVDGRVVMDNNASNGRNYTKNFPAFSYSSKSDKILTRTKQKSQKSEINCRFGEGDRGDRVEEQ